MWPHVNAKWGEDRVSVPGKTYSLTELCKLLTESSQVLVQVAPKTSDIQLWVDVENTPLRKLLWAAEVATGCEIRPIPAEKPEVIYIARRSGPGFALNVGDNYSMFQLPSMGVESPLNMPPVKELLDKSDDFCHLAGERSIGWRLADLPLLYQNMIPDMVRSNVIYRPSETDRLFDPEQTYVFWVQGVEVSVDLLTKDMGGTRVPIILPAW